MGLREFNAALGSTSISRGSTSPVSSGLSGFNAALDSMDVREGRGFLSNSRPREFATSLELTRQQRLAERRAGTELRRMRQSFAREGRLEEFEDFAVEEGAEASFGFENVLDPVFDLLQIGQFSTVGFVQESLRTGSAWEGFKQASIEFANALPGIELEDARRPSFIDVLSEQGASKWTAGSAGLILDILVDPINLIPGGILAKGFMKGGKAAFRASPEVAQEALKKAFVPHYRALKDLPEGERAAFLERLGQFERKAIDDKMVMEDRVETLVGWMKPHERTVFGLFLDSPDKLVKTIEDLRRIGVIDSERIPELLNRAKMINETVEDKISFAADLFGKEVQLGLIDPAMHKAFYMHGTEALDPIMRRAQQRAVKERVVKSGESTILPLGKETLPAAHRRVSGTQYDRFVKQLSGDLDVTTELDVGNILLKRGVDHVRWTNFRKFLDAVATDGRITARVVDDPDIFSSAASIRKFRSQLPEGYDFLPVKRKTLKSTKEADEVIKAGEEIDLYGLVAKDSVKKGKVTEKVVDEIIGGYVMPQNIIDFVKKQEAALSSVDDVGDLLDKADKLTGFWRGWATFGTGYHMRNYISILNMNWIAGVGADYNAVLKGGKWPVPGDFMLRHLQALKLQMLADGAGRLEGLPGKALKAADTMSKDIGFGSFKDIPLPTVKVGGKTLTAEDIVKLGQANDVPQVATKLYNIPDDAISKIWTDFGDKASAQAIEASEDLDDVTKAAMLIGRDEARTTGENLTKVFGNSNPFMQAHRGFGQIIENNGRWALFLDRLMKNHTPAEAALKTKEMHFDYRNLTDIEKRVFRVAMPFYAWQRFAAPRVLMSMLDNPGRFAKMPKVKAAIERMASDIGDVPTPDYYDEVQAMQLPFIHNDRPLFMQLDLPVLEMNRFNIKDISSSLHPISKLFIESAAGDYSLFLSAPIEDFPGQSSEGLPFLSRTAEQNVSNLFPPFGKFLARPARAIARGEAKEQLISEFTGVRLRKLDVRRVTRAKTFEMRQLARDFKKKLEQDLEQRTLF